MKIALLQTDIVWCDEPQNIARANSLIESSPVAELYVLPEMWSTGFVIEAQKVAVQEQDSEALRWMCRTAAERDCAVVGSLVIREQDKFFNRLFFVTKEGVVARYDKRHLFRIGGETKRFTAGTERVVVEWRGVRFLLQVCYDLRFPVFARNRMVDGQPEYDVALYVANFPTVRMQAWARLAAARAIENQAYVVAVNRTGKDGYAECSGGSVLFDAEGEPVIAADDSHGLYMADLDMAALAELRRQFPTLRDGDDFLINH